MNAIIESELNEMESANEGEGQKSRGLERE